MPSLRISSSIAAVAWLSETFGARLNEIVEPTKRFWWLTASGALPGPKWATAESGTILSGEMLTGVPVEVAARPVLASELLARLRAVSLAICAFVVAALVLPAVGTL